MTRRGFLVLSAAFLSRIAIRAQASQGLRAITVHARKFAFVPDAITLRRGETVKLILISDDGRHGLAVRGLGVRSEILPGHPSEVVVTPAQGGDYRGSCWVYCGSGHREMEFMVHVVE